MNIPTWLRLLALALFSNSILARTAAAEPQVVVIADQTHGCNGCGYTYGFQNYIMFLKLMYPTLKTTASFAPADLRQALTGVDTAVIPFSYEQDVASVVNNEAAGILKGFVEGGGKLLIKNDYSNQQAYTTHLLKNVFGLVSVPKDFPVSGSVVCDPSKVGDLNWLPPPTKLEVTESNVVQKVPDGAVTICTADSLPVLFAMPFGDGIIYSDGFQYSQVASVDTDSRKIYQNMFESEIVGAHRCYLAEGTLRCAGSNGFGQLGQGDKLSRPDQYAKLKPVNLGADFVVEQAVDAPGTTCAVSTKGTLKCFGLNKSGQLGVGDVRPRGTVMTDLGDALPPVNLGTTDQVKGVTLGRGHACAVTTKGALYCWGKGDAGQLGHEAQTTIGDEASETAVLVNLGTGAKVKQVVAGRHHTCTLLQNSNVVCFGGNERGQLGIGSTTNVGDKAGSMGAALKTVDLGSDFKPVSLASGDDFTCALSADGTIKCWGANDQGQLGLDLAAPQMGVPPSDIHAPLLAVDLGTDQVAKDLACGRSHCCAVMLSDTMKCWGGNAYGQLGIGDTRPRGVNQADMGDNLPFVQFPRGESVASMSLEGDTTCATTGSGTRCWGANGGGQLAMGDRANLGDSPTTIPRLIQAR